MQNVQEIIETIAAQHATAKKVGKKHFIEFANELIQSLPAPKRRGGTKPASAQTLHLREKMAKLSGTFTVRQSAEQENVEPVLVHNVIKYLQAQGHSISEAGKAARIPGTRGKNPTIWKFGA